MEDGVEIYSKSSGKKITGDYILQIADNGYFLLEKKADLRKIYLELTAKCNLDCITCIRHSWERNPGHMDFTLFKKILNQLEEMPKCKEIVLGGFGEPLLHPRIEKIIASLKERGYQVKITTNGMLLEKELIDTLISWQVDEIIVSVDSFEKERFADIRRQGQLSKVRQNLLNLKERKLEKEITFPRVALEFVLMEKNKEELASLSKHARELGVFSILVTHLLPYQEEMKEQILYSKGEGEQQIALKFWASPVKGSATMCTMNLPSPNWGAERSCDFVSNKACTVTWQGEVSSCYALMHPNRYYIFGREKNVAAHSFGNLQRESLFEIWNSPAYLKFRNRVRYFDYPSCVDCELSDNCTYPEENQDCWGNDPSCADCLWSQNIIRCP